MLLVVVVSDRGVLHKFLQDEPGLVNPLQVPVTGRAYLGRLLLAFVDLLTQFLGSGTLLGGKSGHAPDGGNTECSLAPGLFGVECLPDVG